MLAVEVYPFSDAVGIKLAQKLTDEDAFLLLGQELHYNGIAGEVRGVTSEIDNQVVLLTPVDGINDDLAKAIAKSIDTQQAPTVRLVHMSKIRYYSQRR